MRPLPDFEPQPSLPLRRVAIDFDGVPFAWHPSRPRLSSVANAVSWAAVVFEKRLCAAFRDALPLVDDPHLRAECEAFIAQEATHSRVHKAHVKALETLHPELAPLMGELDALADAHLSHRSLIERIAFGATVEGWLAPLGRYLVAERDRLFAGADVRVTSLFLWHFSEEIEHRSTALRLYRHLRPQLGAPWHTRQRAALATLRLSRAGARLIGGRFRRVDSYVSGAPALPMGRPLLRLVRETLASHRPGFDAGGDIAPAWSLEYLSRIQGGLGPVEALVGVGGRERSRVV